MVYQLDSMMSLIDKPGGKKQTLEMVSVTVSKDEGKDVLKDSSFAEKVSEAELLSTPSGLYRFILQIWPPLVIAGFGSVLTGILLNYFQTWTIFEHLPHLFILIPPLLDLKGDLEMTLNSRLSTEANKGTLRTFTAYKNLVIANLALAQIQAIVVSFLAACYAILLGGTSNLDCHANQALLLVTTSLSTATLAAGIIGIIMSAIIVVSSQYGFNPDNFANSVTASLGDVLTLVILSVSGACLHELGKNFTWVLPCILLGHLALIPTWIRLVGLHKSVKSVLRSGWFPILTAMVISGIAGLTLEEEIEQYPKMALLVPVVNGVGGNIGAVLASRIATSYHMFSKPESKRPSVILFLLAIPTHIVLLFGLDFFTDINIMDDKAFVLGYLLAGIVQVGIVTVLVHVLAAKVWGAGLDPDNWVIPYVTACADLLGTGLLTVAFIKFTTGVVGVHGHTAHAVAPGQ